MTFDLRRDARERPLIVAHRGVAGGNIACNTLQAFDAALYQRADMIELDVAASQDGQLFVFHPGMEHAHLRIDKRLRDMTAREIELLCFVNQDGVPTDWGICTLDAALAHLKDRCYINIDKFWENIAPITEAIRRHDMVSQVLVKTTPDEYLFEEMERIAPDISYMLMLRNVDEYSRRMLGRKLRYVGVEALFGDEQAQVASPAYVDEMHAMGLLVWANSIVYDKRAVIAAGHNDDVSITGQPDAGWGWLLERGYDMIQTDWPLALRLYMEERR